MKPSIGRIVCYKDEADQISPAIITKVNDNKTINIYIFPDDPPQYDEPFRAQGIDEAPGPGDAVHGQWWWPERV